MGAVAAETPYLLHGFELSEFTAHQLMPVHQAVFTYSLGNGEISTHRLDILATSTYALIVGTDISDLFYPRKSLTNSIDHFIKAVLAQFPWIETIQWDVAQFDGKGKCYGVSFLQYLSEDGIAVAEPEWEEIDGKRIGEAIGLGIPRDNRLIGR